MIKIKVVIPNAGMQRDTLDRREKMLSAAIDAETFVSVDCIPSGPATIESQTDEVLAEESILRTALAAEHAGYDAFVVYCFSDPGIGACRELLSIPVVGPGEASLALSLMLGERLGVITSCESNIRRTRERLRKTIHGSRLVSVQSLGMNVASLREDFSATVKVLRAACLRCIEKDEVDVIVLGCLGMAGYGKEIATELGVPILDPAFIAVSTAEMMVKIGVKHAKRGLPILCKETLRFLAPE